MKNRTQIEQEQIKFLILNRNQIEQEQTEFLILIYFL
jgi:hypothetical protein